MGKGGGGVKGKPFHGYFLEPHIGYTADVGMHDWHSGFSSTQANLFEENIYPHYLR